MSPAEEKLSVLEKVGYGLGDTASNLYWKLFEYFLLYFYTDVFGISSKAAGTMLLVTKIWDAMNDPMMGYIADRTRTTWGRFRPYLLWMSVPLAITGVLTFYVPDLSPNGKLAYSYVTYTLVMMAYTAINIPYGALMGVITPNSLERTSVSTYRFVAAFIGGIVVQSFTLSLVNWFGRTGQVNPEGVAIVSEQAGFFWTVLLFAIVACLLFTVTFLTTRERVQPEVSQPSTFREDLRFVTTSFKLHQIILIGLSLLVALSLAFDPKVLTWVGGCYLGLTVLSLVATKVLGSKNTAAAGS
ncbi:MAG: MFS transporter, partial [Planctomycetota bacterium]